MTFSLILGTAGRAEELHGILSSLCEQTYRDFELIVVDQNADDRLGPVLERYAGRFPIRRLRSEPGLSVAKNLGLSRASGGMIGFPDDDCRYPPDVLERAARFFADHPSIDGLTGRAVDEDGNPRASTAGRKAGGITRYNVWRRGFAPNIFLRAGTARSAHFDEEMGPGAGTSWQAGDETDYLLQLLEGGASLYYDPTLVIFHPREPTSRSDAAALHRAYAYACGGSHAIKKHRFPLWFRAWWVIRSAGALLLPSIGLKTPSFRYRWNTLRGKIGGLR